MAVGNEYFPRLEVMEAASMMHAILAHYASTQVSSGKGKEAHPPSHCFHGIPQRVASTEDAKRAPGRAMAIIKGFREMYRALMLPIGVSKAYTREKSCFEVLRAAGAGEAPPP